MRQTRRDTVQTVPALGRTNTHTHVATLPRTIKGSTSGFPAVEFPLIRRACGRVAFSMAFQVSPYDDVAAISLVTTTRTFPRRPGARRKRGTGVHGTGAGGRRLRLMPALRLPLAWTVTTLAALRVARMRRAGLRVAASCFACRRLRRGCFVFGRRYPMVEINRRRTGGLLRVSLGLLQWVGTGRVV